MKCQEYTLIYTISMFYAMMVFYDSMHLVNVLETKWEDGFVSLVKGIVADVKYYSNNDDFAVQNVNFF